MWQKEKEMKADGQSGVCLALRESLQSNDQVIFGVFWFDFNINVNDDLILQFLHPDTPANYVFPFTYH